MYCYDTGKQEAIHYPGIYVQDVAVLAPLIIGIRAESGNGEGHFQMNGGNITKRDKKVIYPDESKKSA